MPGRIANSRLAASGRASHERAARRIGIIGRIVKKNGRTRPLAGLRLGFCLHVTKETSVLAMAAKSLGAEIAICSANPLSAQDHPPEVMALSFANQLLSILHVAKNHSRMERKVHAVPEKIDD